MITITLCTRQQKRHWCMEQSYGLCGRGRGREDVGEWTERTAVLPACEPGPSFPPLGPRTALCSPGARDNCLTDGWVGGEVDRWMNKLRRKAQRTGRHIRMCWQTYVFTWSSCYQAKQWRELALVLKTEVVLKLNKSKWTFKHNPPDSKAAFCWLPCGNSKNKHKESL